MFEGARVVAALGVTWIAAAMDVPQAAARYVPRLKELARRISAELEEDRLAVMPAHMAGAERGFAEADTRRW